MKTLYLDLFSGVSGDMFVGALLDLGVDAGELQRRLAALGVEGYHLHIGRKQNGGIEGIKFDVHLDSESDAHSHEHGHEHEHTHAHAHDHDHSHGHSQSHDTGHEHPHEDEHSHEHQHEAHRNFAQIRNLIAASSLSPWVKEKATAVFARLAAAEGKIHGLPPDEVHFHEVGAVDSIVDIVGACLGLELLGRPRVLASAATDGSGWIDCAHGRLPVPAPATLVILGARRIPLTQCEEPAELITPTGAALVAEFVESFGPLRDFVPERVGFGVGTRRNKTRPNVLRAVLGETQNAGPARDWETDTVAVLATNLDDLSPEILGSFVARALADGALDVFYTPVQMKKNRPGVLLTVLCAEAEADRFAELILRETSAFGVRRHTAERRKLLREFVTVETPFGAITVKLGKLNGRVVQAAPEFESCKTAAERSGAPMKDVYAAALKALNL